VCRLGPGRRPRCDSHVEYDYYGFGLTILAHSVTILRLADAPSEGALVERYKFIDFSSGVTLSRAMLEAYAGFVYLFLNEPDGAERELKHAIWELSDLVARQTFPADAEWAKAKLARDAQRMETLRSTIEANEAFRARPPKQQARLRAGPRPVEVDFVEVGRAAGLYPPFLHSFYWLLCSHAHSGYISVSQSYQVGTLEEQKQMMRMSLQTGLVMAGFLFGFAELFEEAHNVLEANKR
jgi:hypothetical protein